MSAEYVNGEDRRVLHDDMDPLEPALDSPEDGWPAEIDEAAYYGVLGHMVRAVEQETEADPVGILGSLLTMFGVAVGDGPALFQGTLQHCKLQVVLVGRSSKSRKGTGYDVAKMLIGAGFDGFSGLVWPGVASGEAVPAELARMRKAAEQEGEPAEYRALIYEPEFARLLKSANREGSNLSPVLRMAWDGGPLGNIRAKTGERVDRHHVGMIGHVTRQDLAMDLTDTDSANGFANRILFLSVRRPRIIALPRNPTELIDEYKATLRAAVEHGQAMRQWARWTADAEDTWTAFYEAEAQNEVLGLAGAVTARHEAQVARLALTYAVADGAIDVDVPHLQAAIAVADYARRSAVAIFGQSTGDRHADELWAVLRRNGGRATWQQGQQAVGLKAGPAYRAAVQMLLSLGLAGVEDIPREGGGRPRREIVLR